VTVPGLLPTTADLRIAAETTAKLLADAQDQLLITVERLLDHAGAGLPHRGRLESCASTVRQLREHLDDVARELQAAARRDENRQVARNAVAQRQAIAVPSPTDDHRLEVHP